jgi:thiol-disulfide isomerase/thioredoxin
MNSSSKSPVKRRFWTTGRIALTLAATIIVAAIGSSSCNTNTAGVPPAGGASTPAPVKAGAEPAAGSAAVTIPVPAAIMNASVKTLGGETFKLADYAGKVLVLDVWATWCGPCRQEIPFLVELSKEYKSQGVEVVGLTVEDPVADLQTVKDFARQYNISYKIGWADRDLAVGLMRGRDAIPQTLVITRDGRLFKHFYGFNSATHPVKMREAVEQALNL